MAEERVVVGLVRRTSCPTSARSVAVSVASSSDASCFSGSTISTWWKLEPPMSDAQFVMYPSASASTVYVPDGTMPSSTTK